MGLGNPRCPLKANLILYVINKDCYLSLHLPPSSVSPSVYVSGVNHEFVYVYGYNLVCDFRASLGAAFLPLQVVLLILALFVMLGLKPADAIFRTLHPGLLRGTESIKFG